METDPIKLAIRKKGYNYAEFAAKAGISRITLYNLLGGKYVPSAETLCKIAAALGWSNRRLAKLLVERYVNNNGKRKAGQKPDHRDPGSHQ